ncbi:Kinesin- protein 11 [Aphanomyces cochlioides]|nr:Kinesin- protein 11 [Aphanomyces cochlioides]
MLRRHEMVLLCTVGTMLCYADRTNIGVALPSFEPDHDKQGRILSAFFYGYICTQMLGAHWASLYGAKRVLLVGVFVWTVFDLLTIPAASSSTWVLCVVRAGMGLGEGILFPTMHVVAATWYPQSERSRLIATVSSGVDLGTILSMLIAPLLLSAFGWRTIFLSFGGLSALWLIWFGCRAASKPETDPLITTNEKAAILAQRDTPALNKSISTRHLLTSRAVWAIYCSHFALNYGWYVLLGWLPLYFRLKLHIPLASSGFSSACPYIAGYVGILVWGYVSDKWIQRGQRPLVVRKVMNAVGLVGAALCLVLLRFAHSTTVAVVLLSLTLFLARAATMGYWVHMVDMAPGYAGHIMGMSNTIGTLSGIVGNLFTGWMLGRSEENWDVVFGVAASILVWGAIMFELWAAERLEGKPSRGEKAQDNMMTAHLLDDDLHLESDEFFI